MQKYIFKKGGINNKLILNSFISFIKQNFSNKRKIVLIEDGKPTVHPCYKMLHPGDITSLISTVFNDECEEVNYVLTIDTSHHTENDEDKMIWMGDNSTVTFYEDRIEFYTSPDGKMRTLSVAT